MHTPIAPPWTPGGADNEWASPTVGPGGPPGEIRGSSYVLTHCGRTGTGAREMWQMDWFSYALGALWAFAAFSYGRWLGNKEEKKLLAPVIIRRL